MLALAIISIVVGTINLGKILYLDSYLINIFWVIYNIPGLLVSLKIAYQPARNISKENLFSSNNSKNEVNDYEIEKCINTRSYSNLDKIMDNILENIKPYKSNLVINNKK